TQVPFGEVYCPALVPVSHIRGTGQASQMLPVDYLSRRKADGEARVKIERSILKRVGLFVLKIEVAGSSKACFFELPEDNIFDSRFDVDPGFWNVSTSEIAVAKQTRSPRLDIAPASNSLQQ